MHALVVSVVFLWSHFRTLHDFISGDLLGFTEAGQHM